MKKLLFVCTGNSHRSILAESVVNKYHKDKFAGYSAGKSTLLRIINRLTDATDGEI
ncbi:arsenate reductase ArsC, partial [Pelagibacterales bacterium SAG-MED02]|nr:arsenate reductase ArsC [Pelagibacterales bacterium SAG-MED02]